MIKLNDGEVWLKSEAGDLTYFKNCYGLRIRNGVLEAYVKVEDQLTWISEEDLLPADSEHDYVWNEEEEVEPPLLSPSSRRRN